MVAACQEMAVYCFDSLLSHFTGTPPPSPVFEPGHHPLFVTWKKVLSNGETRLRGCIGTLEPRCILTGFKDYALISALQDRRFTPIQLKELNSLQVSPRDLLLSCPYLSIHPAGMPLSQCCFGRLQCTRLLCVALYSTHGCYS